MDRYEVEDLDGQVIYTSPNLRPTVAFINRWARENPNQRTRFLVRDYYTQQVLAAILNNGKIQRIHHFLHESLLPAETHMRETNKNLRTFYRTALSLGQEPAVEYEPRDESILLKSKAYHQQRLNRLIELGAPKVIIEGEKRSIKEAEEEEKSSD